MKIREASVKARLLFILSALVLQGCGTLAYTPMEWSVREGVIPRFDVAGSVKFENAQTAAGPAIVYSYGGTKLVSTYQTITALMTEQAENELRKNGNLRNGVVKKIELKVTLLRSRYIAFFWKSVMEYEVRLGAGEIIKKRVTHGSGNVQQDLNGCIAEGVIELFKDEKVKAYLAM